MAHIAPLSAPFLVTPRSLTEPIRFSSPRCPFRIVQRRSTDGGRTWGPYSWAVSDHSTDPSRPDMDIGGNPSALFDPKTGKIVLQFVRGPPPSFRVPRLPGENARLPTSP